MKKQLLNIENGSTFMVGGVEFIKFSDVDGITTAVTKNIVFNSTYGNDNNFAQSIILERLNDKFLPNIIDAIGEENVCEITTDLTTLDGLKPYGELVSKISLPTFDFYRSNVEIFDKYPVNDWWWTATPDTAKPHYKPVWVTCVSPSGIIHGISCYFNFGVRPFLRFVSSIFVSSEE